MSLSKICKLNVNLISWHMHNIYDTPIFTNYICRQLFRSRLQSPSQISTDYGSFLSYLLSLVVLKAALKLNREIKRETEQESL